MCTTYLFESSWEEGYEAGIIGRALAHGQGFCFGGDEHYTPTASVAPMYPAIYALFLIILKHHAITGLLLLNITLAGCICYILYLLGKNIFDHKTGLIAALLYAGYPSAIFYDIRHIWPTTLTTLLLLLIFYRLTQFTQDKRSINSLVLTGIMFGLSILVDPVLIIMYPALCFLAFFQPMQELRYRMRSLLIITAMSLLILAPWTIRNALVFRQLVPIKSNFGYNLWIGNNAHASGTQRISQTIKIQPDETLMTALRKEHDEMGVDKAYLHAALQFIKNNPQQAVNLFFKKWYYFWWRIPYHHLRYDTIRHGTYVFILCCAGMGTIMAWRDKKRRDVITIILITALSFSLLFAITQITQYRRRFILEILLLIPAAYALIILRKEFLKNLDKKS